MPSTITVVPSQSAAPTNAQVFIVHSVPRIINQAEIQIVWDMVSAYKNTIPGATGNTPQTGVNLPKGFYNINLHVPVESSGVNDTFGLKVYRDNAELTGSAGGAQFVGWPITQQNGNNKAILTLNVLAENPTAVNQVYVFNVTRLYGDNITNSFCRIPDTSGLLQITRLGDTS